MSAWLLIAAGAGLLVGWILGVAYARRQLAHDRTWMQCQYGVARAELEQRAKFQARAEVAAYRKVDLCPTPAGCMDTMKIGMN